jgi:uncharacterized protein YcaQ
MATKPARSRATPQPVARLTWEQVLAWRVRRHHLDRRAPRAAMLDVAAAIGGLQAQVMSCAELTLWARVESLEPEAVQRALWEERTLINTWAMRGTLHLLPSAELPLWLTAFGIDRRYFTPAWLRYFGTTREELEQMAAAVAQALDGRSMTRGELADEVVRITGAPQMGEWLRGSWGSFLKPVAYRGHLCFAPSTGQNVRFTRPDRWLDGWQATEPEHAQREATRRYLAAYGPATRDTFASWSGATLAHVRRLIESLGDEVSEVEVDGTRGWMLTEHVAELADATPSGSVRLLPGFDQYVLGAPRAAPAVLLPSAFKSRVYRNQGWISPVLLIDGGMAGVWRHERKGSRLEVRIEPFGEVPVRARRAAEEEAERLAQFLGGALTLNWAS